MSREVAEPGAKGGVPTASAAESRKLRLSTFSALAEPGFRLLWLNTVLSSCIQGILRFAFVWLVIKDLGQGSGSAGLVAFALGIPTFFLVLPAGVLSDRMNRRLLLMGSQALAGTVMIITAIVITMEVISVPIALVLAAIVGGTQAFGLPVQQAILPSLVDRSRLMNAVVLTTMGANVTMIVGPALGGAAIALGGIEGAFITMAVLYMLGFLVILPLKIPNVITQTVRRNPLREMKDGIGFLMSRTDLKLLVLIQMVSSFFMLGPIFTVLPQFAKDELGAEAFKASSLFAFIGIGMLTMSLILASMGDAKNKGVLYVSSLAVHGVLVIGMGLSPTYAVAAIVIMLWGAAGGIMVNMTRTLLQGNTPPELMGRVMSIYGISVMGVQPMGSLAAGLVADVTGIPALLVGLGVFLSIFSGLIILTQPVLRRME